MSCHLISLSFSRARVAEVTSLQVFQLTFYCPWSHVNWMSMNFMCRIQDHRKYRHINIELNMNAEIQWSWRNRAICTSTVCFTVCFGPLTIQNEYLEALWRHHIHQHPGEESLKFNRYKKKSSWSCEMQRETFQNVIRSSLCLFRRSSSCYRIHSDQKRYAALPR